MRHGLLKVFYLVGFLTLGYCFPLLAEDAGQAKVVGIKGDVKFLKAGAYDWAVLQQGMILSEGDAIKTGEDGEAKLELIGTKKTADVTVRKSSEFQIKTLRQDKGSSTDSTLLDIEVGSVLVKAEKLIGESRFEVKTPTSIVGIRGTTFEVNVSKS